MVSGDRLTMKRGKDRVSPFAVPIAILAMALVPNPLFGQMPGFRANCHPDDAYELYGKGQWEKALPLIEQLSRQSPRNPDFHYALGMIYYQLGRFPDSINSFRENIAHGAKNGLSYTWLALGRAYAKNGDPEKALECLLVAFRQNIELQERIEQDPLFDGFRDRKEYREQITGAILPDRHTRDEAWRADLGFLVRLIENTHVSPFRFTDKTEWRQAVAAVDAAIPEMKNHEIVAALQRIAALPGDGHTAVYNPRLPSSEELAFHHLPLMLYYFGEQLYVRAAAPEYETLVGKRVLKFGDRNVGEVEEVFWRHQHGFDNRMQFYWMAPWYFVVPEMLNCFGATDSLTAVQLSVVDDGGDREVITVKTDQLLTKAYQRSTAPDHWVNMRGPDSAATPLYLQDPENSFWHRHDDSQGVVYFQINRVRNGKEESLREHTRKVLELVEKENCRALVVDVRLNNGGDTRLARDVVKELMASGVNTRGRLFVVTGRNTFSAAMNLCSLLEKWTEAIFVGEPTGSSPNFVGEEKNVRLPYSRLVISVSNVRWMGGNDSLDSRKWIAPELGAVLTADDYRNNVDPSYDAIIRYLNHRK